MYWQKRVQDRKRIRKSNILVNRAIEIKTKTAREREKRHTELYET
jgi:hypothetical protein